MIDDDHALALRAHGSDPRAFDVLVERHRASALRVATVVLGDRVGADDVVQDATVRAWRAIGGLEPERGFRSWYLRAVANTARNERRSRGRRAALTLRRTATDVAPDDPEATAITTEERLHVLAALNLLGTDDRLILALRYFEDLSIREMAEVLGCPEGTVKSRLSRAMGKLRGHLVPSRVAP